MPFQYSFEEKTEMLLIFGECGRDATLAAETKASFSWWLYKRGSLGLETARPMGAQLLKNAAAWLGLC
jgi:hypothetical protein